MDGIFLTLTQLKINNIMQVDLCQSELNELIYALGVAQREGKLLDKRIADRVDIQLRKALDAENERLEKVLEKDRLDHEMNFKHAFAKLGNW